MNQNLHVETVEAIQ